MRIPGSNGVQTITAKDAGLSREDISQLRVAQYIPVYRGYRQEPQDPSFVTNDDPVYDMEGWDVDGNTSGYWRVWENWSAWLRDYPEATYDDRGTIVV